MTESLSRKTAVELASLIASKEVGPVEVLDSHLAAISRVNPKLNAIVTLVTDAAREQAREAEAAVLRGDKLGALHGLPVVIKDITPTKGIRTTYGSSLFKDNVPSEDAEVVRRLKAAGAIVLGKTNTPEFGAGANTFNEVFGVTRNPWNPALSRPVRPADRRSPWPPEWRRWRKVPISAARSGCRRRSAALSASGRRRD